MTVGGNAPASASADLLVCLKAAFQEAKVAFSKSSGPGGQNVNKSNTKATLSWNVSQSRLDERLRALLLRRLKLNNSGEIALSSQRFRTQELNLRQCRLKLRETLEAALKRTKRRVKTGISAGQKERRIKDKKKKKRCKEGAPTDRHRRISPWI